jgi:hypothetical protein
MYSYGVRTEIGGCTTARLHFSGGYAVAPTAIRAFNPAQLDVSGAIRSTTIIIASDIRDGHSNRILLKFNALFLQPSSDRHHVVSAWKKPLAFRSDVTMNFPRFSNPLFAATSENRPCSENRWTLPHTVLAPFDFENLLLIQKNYPFKALNLSIRCAFVQSEPRDHRSLLRTRRPPPNGGLAPPNSEFPERRHIHTERERPFRTRSSFPTRNSAIFHPGRIADRRWPSHSEPQRSHARVGAGRSECPKYRSYLWANGNSCHMGPNRRYTNRTMRLNSPIPVLEAISWTTILHIFECSDPLRPQYSRLLLASLTPQGTATNE